MDQRRTGFGKDLYSGRSLNRPILFSIGLSFVLGKLYFTNPYYFLTSFLVSGFLFFSLFEYFYLQKEKRKEILKVRKWMETLVLSLESGASLFSSLNSLCARNRKERSLKALQKELNLGKSNSACLIHLGKEMKSKELEKLGICVEKGEANGISKSQLIHKTLEELGISMKIKEEMDDLLSQRILEGFIVALAPFAFSFLLKTFASDYMEVLDEPKGQLLLIFLFLFQCFCIWSFFQIYVFSKNRDRLLEFSDFERSLALGLSSGLNPVKAWTDASLEVFSYGNKGELYDYLKAVFSELSFGRPFFKAIQTLNYPRAEVLVSLLEKNEDAGSKELADLVLTRAKEEEEQALNEIRKRDKSKETYVLFPMMGLLISTFVLVAAPAFMSL